MPPALTARNAESDPSFMLLYHTYKSLIDGKPDFKVVARKMGLASEGAASQRFSRLLKVQEDAEDGTVTTGAEGPIAKPFTSSKGKGKKKIEAKTHAEDVDEEASKPVPSRNAKARKKGDAEAQAEDEGEDAPKTKKRETVKTPGRQKKEIAKGVDEDEDGSLEAEEGKDGNVSADTDKV